MDRQFPNLLFPAFHIQEQMQKKFMGVKWWARRKQLFYEARLEISGPEAKKKAQRALAIKNGKA
jgi:hypothetical protein